MPRLIIFAGSALAALLAGCGPTETPVLGTPVTIAVPSATSITGPRISSGVDGRLVVSWLQSDDDNTALRFADISAKGIGMPATVVSEGRMFVNWADLPSVMQVAEEHWIAHWLRYSADKTYSYDVVVAQSFDDGQSWTDPVVMHDDGTETEHGFVSMHRYPEGVGLLWLDGRETPDASMTLRTATITPDGAITRGQLVDDTVCDCCQTDVAVSSRGPIAVYRDRSADEVRDIYVTRFVDGAWLPGEPLHDDGWVIPGCPVNGPSIVARDERVAVAWFSAADESPVVQVVMSGDGGTSFSAPVEIARGHLAGYVDLAMLNDGSLAVSWVSRDESGANLLNIRHVATTGDAGPVHSISKIDQLRVFPQIGFESGNLYVVWADRKEDSRFLQAVRIPVALP